MTVPLSSPINNLMANSFKDNAREIEITCSFRTAQSYIHFSIINYYFKPYLSLVYMTKYFA